MAKAKETVATYNEPPPVEEEAKPKMVDDRTAAQRLADVRAIVLDRQNALAREIESGKPAMIHPCVVTDAVFLLEQIDARDRKLRLYEKNLESVEA